MGKLDNILNYSLIGKTYRKSKMDQDILSKKPPVLAVEWTKSAYENVKKNIRTHYGRRQKRRCAYCRSLISPDGYGYPIEHITCRNKKPRWMFADYNLVVSCVGCNSSKGTDNVLIRTDQQYGNSETDCPSTTNAYRIFNPHFDTWSDHFEIEDEFFLVPKPNTKGPFTYNTCNMYRYHIVLDYRDQISLRDKKTFRNITKRMRREKDRKKLEHLYKAKEAILDMIENY